MVEEHIKTIAKGAGLFFVGTIFSKVLHYFYRLIMARWMGPEVYGIFSLCFAVVSVVAAMTVFGLPSAIERYVPYHIKDKSKVKGIVLSILQMGTATSTITMILLYLFAGKLAMLFGNNAVITPLRIFVLAIPPLAILTIYESISRAFKKIEYMVYSHFIVYSIINMIAAIISVVIGVGIIGISYGFLIACIAALVIILILIEKNSFKLINSVKATFMRKEIFAFSWPLAIAGIFGLLIGWIDTIIIGYFMTENFVGLYNAAMPTVNLLLVVPFSVVTMFVPATAELMAKKMYDEIKKSHLIAAEWIFFVNFPIFLLFMVFPQQILGVLFGEGYKGVGLVLSILSVGFFMYSMALPSLKMLELFKQTKYYMIVTSSAVILNIVLAIILTQQYGLVGTAIASSVALSTFFIVSTVKISLVEKGIPVSISFVKSAVVAIGLLLGIYFLAKFVFGLITPIRIIPLAFAYLGLYSAIMFMFVFREEEKELLQKVINKLKLPLTLYSKGK